jgi:hypothetical protein
VPVKHGGKVTVSLPPRIQEALGRPSFDPHWLAAVDQALQRFHERYDRGDKTALLEAVELYLVAFGADWVVEAFMESWSQYLRGDVATLGEAFGVVRPKKTQLEKVRADERARPLIVFRAYELYGQGMPFDKDMWETVGEELGIHHSKVERIFGEPASEDLRELLRRLPDFKRASES